MKILLSGSHGCDSGFTLLELLVAVTIIGILAGIAIPLYSQYLDNSFEARVKSDLRSVALAEEAYFVDNEVFISCVNSNCVTQLPGVISLSRGVSLTITGTATGFTGQATHPNLSTTCQWDSSGAGFTGCS